MIDNEDEFQVALWLRQKIIDMIAGVEDATDLGWSDTSPNWLTDSRLNEFIKEAIQRLEGVGVVRIEGYAPCGASKHEALAAKASDGSGYWRLVVDGRAPEAKWLKGIDKVELDGIGMDVSAFDFIRPKSCPCQPKSKTNNASVVEFFAWRTHSRTKNGSLVSVVEILKEARRKSQEKRPRSGVREQLLRGLLMLEATIAPVSAADHIAHRGEGLKGPTLVTATRLFGC